MENEAGALSRVAGLFSARGYNIESLTVAPTEDDTISRMTIVTTGSEEIIEQITKQLNKLIDVIKLVELTDGEHIEREMLLIKVKAKDKVKDEITRLCEIFRGHIIDVSEESYVIEVSGDSEKLDAFIKSLGKMEIIEVVRSGVSGIARGSRSLDV